MQPVTIHLLPFLHVTLLVYGGFAALVWKFIAKIQTVRLHFYNAFKIYNLESKSRQGTSASAISPQDASEVIRPMFISSSP